MKNDTRQILADNVTKLMKRHPLLSSQEKIAKKAQKPGGKKVAQTSVGYLLRPHSQISPKLDTICAVADVFHLDPWKLIHPTLGESKNADLPPSLNETNLATCIQIFDEMLPSAIPASEKARIIVRMYSLMRPDGSIHNADIVELIRPFREQEPGGQDAGSSKVVKAPDSRRSKTGSIAGMPKLRNKRR